MSLDQLRQSLSEVNAGLASARAHADRAKELLEECRRIMVDAQTQAQPWLPTQLPAALDQVESQRARLAGIGDLLDNYQARL
ncbi:hypothetical protein BAY61_29610 [Prauserella marina]|uniref:Uncharacterized protein n=1 Tax=Prauserella marina TaxID=530584 RepID=A0A222VXN9_9PSEU|nr:hypothetical protein [Prauserella marina]ASR38471.1 hypothetical protein BAY61_29610 [Prauserella marina]PWV78285.1 hypothetical protein DES30_10413 [Prauserella marina]SDC82571.1 hypothetical protein SAMN05421630_10413 [Prauserella marina]